MTDTESNWWHWHVTERRGGLSHQYRDARFEVLSHDPTLRRAELTNPDPAAAQPGRPGSRDRV